MALGNRVRIRRKKLRMTQVELAQRVGLRPCSISRLESRDSRSSGKLQELAIALDTNTTWLDTGAGAPGDRPDQMWTRLMELWRRMDPGERGQLLDQAEMTMMSGSGDRVRPTGNFVGPINSRVDGARKTHVS